MTTDIATPNNTKEMETNSNLVNEKSTLELNTTSDNSSKTKEKSSKPQKSKNKSNKGGCRNLFFALKCWGNSTTDEEEGKVRAKEPTSLPIPTITETQAQPEPESKSEIPEDIITSVTKDQAPVTIDPVDVDVNRASMEFKNFLLPPIAKEHIGKKCLVLDLDETLVHSSFKLIEQPDFIVPVEIDNQVHNVYVAKRPGVDDFLFKVGELFEVVVFTASLSKYADPVLDMLDRHKVVYHRLFRESCYNHHGNYVKDLSQLGRDLAHTIIIDNSPTSYIFHPSNAVPITTWFNDKHDTELMDLIPFLTDLTIVPDVTAILDNVNLESA